MDAETGGGGQETDSFVDNVGCDCDVIYRGGWSVLGGPGLRQ